MLTRRNIALILALNVVGGSRCGGGIVESRPELRSLAISLPPERTGELLGQLRVFASEGGFEFGARESRSSVGTEHSFELRSRTIWIEGGNPLKDIPADVPMPSNGKPVAPMEIDARRFDVGFYRGNVEPSAAELDGAVNAFISSVSSLDSVVVIERARR